MFGSDYPHPASTWPYSQHIIEEQIEGMSPDIAMQKTRLIKFGARALN
jgi:hypothetical protein